ncbi:MAG: hypothetical protein HYZ17_08175 [Betaproteobacteria bacterium]|nr:hypothetical protein [Betaproteobacteria bacterium]
MLILRLIFFLMLATIGGGLTLYLFTRERHYLRFAWRSFQVSLALVVLIMLFYVFERVVLMV